MSEAPPPISPEEAMLARLAVLDVSLAERVHAAAMAATDADEINSLGRTYQRVARSMRQTLALQARFKRDREREQAQRPQPKDDPPEPYDQPMDVADRVLDLQEAVGRIAVAALPGEEERVEALLDDMDRYLDYECERPDFTTHDLTAHIRAHCARLELPEDLADTWRDLPRAPWNRSSDDDDGSPAPDEPLPPGYTYAAPWRSSG